jgi:ATP-dependent 26S proteasome regulatory subunit
MLSRTDQLSQLPRSATDLAQSSQADKQLKQGVRVSLDMTTLTIMRILPREVDPMVS